MLPDFKAIAERLEREAREERAKGHHEAASSMFAAAADIRATLEAVERPGVREVLSRGESSDNLQAMTGAQLQRRGKAIAKAKAAKSDDPLWAAIVTSKWGSQERYARDRLKVSPGSLSAYRSGGTPCPRAVAALVEKDFGIGADYWKGGVVE